MSMLNVKENVCFFREENPLKLDNAEPFWEKQTKIYAIAMILKVIQYVQ